MREIISKILKPHDPEKGAFRFETFMWFVGLSGCLFLYNNCSQQKFLFQYTQDAQRDLSTKDNSILIENGAKYTNRQDVQVQIFSSEGYEFYLTNDPTCATGGNWEQFVPSRAWKLAKSNQSVPVYAKFRRPGQAASECLSDSIIHDGIAPVPAYVKVPSAITNQALSPFQLSAQDNLSGVAFYECSEGQQSFDKCQTTLNKTVSSDGTKSFSFRATDEAGNVSSPAVYSWLFDSTPPEVTLNLKPATVSGSTSAQFAFSGNDNLSGVVKFECAFNTAAFSDCSSGTSQYSGLNETQHIFKVAAFDRAGNRSAEVSYSFKVDLTRPSVTITKTPPAFSNSKSGTFEFVGIDEGKPLTRFQCRIDGGAYSNCSSPYSSPALPDGSHKFGVITFDDAGNASEESTYSWMIDTVAPTIQFTQVPGAYSNSNNQSIRYDSQDSGSGIAQRICYFDSAVVSCDNQVIALTQIGEGAHFVTAMVKDKAGNSSVTIRSDFIIDTTAPTIQILTHPNAKTNFTTSPFTFEGKDSSGIQKYLCRVDGGTYADCTSPFSTVGLVHGSHDFYVVAVDKAGNSSISPAQYNWFIDTRAPDIFVVKKIAANYELGNSAVTNFYITDDSNFTYSCLLDAAAYDCKLNTDHSFNLSPGNHSFVISAQDEFGQISSTTLAWVVTNSFNKVTEGFSISPANRDLDVLFVIDNSGSMIEEQSQLKARINGFVSRIAKTNFKIGLTTTDPTSNGAGSDGNLVTVSAGNYIINAGDANAQETLGNAVMQGIKGSGDERAIRATYRALERSLTPGSPNSNLFRTNSSLSVIVISDENNCSTGCSTADAKDSGPNLIQTIKNRFGANKRFQFHSIIKIPGSTDCNTAAEFGTEYAQLSDLTGGIKGNICAADYSSILASIGDTVAGLTRSLDLKCNPVDSNNDGVVNSGDVQILQSINGMQAPLQIGFSVMNNRLTFSQDLPEGAQLSATFTCRK